MSKYLAYSLMVVVMAIVSTFSTAARAHQTGESYIYLQVFEDRLTGRYEIPLQDLAKLFDFDADGDGDVTKQEFEARLDEVEAHFQPRISFEIAGTKAPIRFTDLSYFDSPAMTFVKMAFDVDWSGALPDEITVHHVASYDDADPNHRVLVLIESSTITGLEYNEAQHSLIFAGGDDRQVLNLAGVSPWDAFTKFLGHGIHHLVIGFDHIAFLMAIILPSVLIARGGTWVPTPNFGSALWNILKIATVFTIAHSVTLSLAALGFVRLPAAPVEALIALSIVAAAAGNLFSTDRRWLYPAVFFLGLLHGLGFANVLAPLAMERITLLPSLVGFNLGVEIGQIAIISVPFMVLFLIRTWQGYVPYVLKGGSLALICLAFYWFAERGLDFVSRLI